LEEKQFMESFRNAITERNLKYTKQRDAIAKVVWRVEQHLTLDDILRHSREHHPSVGYATVYRTMKLLVECNLAIEHRFTDGQTRFERHSQDHHDHMICITCGKIVEFEDDLIEDRQNTLALEHGFKVVSHRHEVYVDCLDDDCPEKQATSGGHS
jgi:Fur family ferric uptake transcriptional regulator